MSDELFARELALSTVVKLVVSGDILVKDTTKYAGEFLAFLLGDSVPPVPVYTYYGDEPRNGYSNVFPPNTYWYRYDQNKSTWTYARRTDSEQLRRNDIASGGRDVSSVVEAWDLVPATLDEVPEWAR